MPRITADHLRESFLNKDLPVANQHLTLRPAEAGDDDFLYRLYASTRADEMALVNWSAGQKEAFLQMQLRAHTMHYRAHYPNADYKIIQREDGAPIGRLIVDRSKESILVIDIALLPEYRNKGIGTLLLTDLEAWIT